jgi:hypothetical protein
MTALITPATPTTNGTIAAELDSLLLVWGVVYAAADGPWFPWPL